MLENKLILQNPTPQTALDIFKDTWISRLPGVFAHYTAGNLPLFEDSRIPESEKYLGPVKGKRVLDLGPLEGGQAYVLEKLGAESIVSIEANSILYLKCLIIKEILGLRKVRFLCGDVIEYLKNTTEEFDMCVASGILYHMTNPAELLWLLSRTVKRVMIWTHYVDAAGSRNKIVFQLANQEFNDKTYNYYRQEYGNSFETATYCGGTQNYSNWMTKDDIIQTLTDFGYIDIHVIQDGDSVNGPFMLLTAKK